MSYDSEGGHGVPGGDAATLPDDSGKENRGDVAREREGWMRGEQVGQVFSDKWKTTHV